MTKQFQTLDIESMRSRLKAAAEGRAGMILIHNGIVRNSSRSGEPVAKIDVSVDRAKLDEILNEARQFPGIVAVEVEINEGVLEVGDDVMLLGVAGDIRENVLNCLSGTLNRIKKEVTSKKEYRL